MDVIFEEHLPEPNTQRRQQSQIISAPGTIQGNLMNNYSMDSNMLSFQELMDWTPCTTESIASTYDHNNEGNYTVINDE